jgi:peroxiredoxin
VGAVIEGGAPGQPIVNFSLLDYKGKYHELRQADGKVVVLFFTRNGCPIARQCISKIRSLRSKFGKQGVVFWMVDSNLADDRQSIAEEAKEFGVGSIPILMDEKQALARTLGIKRTAEAVAISTTNSTIFYRGAIDDQLTEGAAKPAARNNYLQNALSEFLEGKAITTAQTKVSGCLINFPGDAKADSKETVSYSKEVAPLLEKK